MIYSSEAHQALFQQPMGEMAVEALRHRLLDNYRVKTFWMGNTVECEIYPIWNTRTQAVEAKKAMEKAGSREAQKKLNAKNAYKKIQRKLENNFGPGLWVTFTYRNPPNETEAKKDAQNLIRRVRRWRKSQGMPELKYVYVVAYEEEGEKKKRVHLHMVLSEMDRDVLEGMWEKGYANCRKLQHDENGLEGLARYILKNKKSGRRWCCSKNLKDPIMTVADKKISRRTAGKIAKAAEEEAGVLFGRAYPGYELVSCEVRRSDFVAGAYIYARLHRREAGKGEKRNTNSPGGMKGRGV